MKSNGWIRSKRLGVRLAGRFAPTSRRYAFLERKSRTNRFGNMLSNSVLQLLGGTAYIPTVAVAWELIYQRNMIYQFSVIWFSDVIYQFSYYCDNWYIDHTSQRQQNRIKQHVPKFTRSCSSSQKRLLPARQCKSSTQTRPIPSHLLLIQPLDFIFFKIIIPGQHRTFWRNVVAVASSWQHCVWFDWPEIWTSTSRSRGERVIARPTDSKITVSVSYSKLVAGPKRRRAQTALKAMILKGNVGSNHLKIRFRWTDLVRCTFRVGDFVAQHNILRCFNQPASKRLNAQCHHVALTNRCNYNRCKHRVTKSTLTVDTVQLGGCLLNFQFKLPPPTRWPTTHPLVHHPPAGPSPTRWSTTHPLVHHPPAGPPLNMESCQWCAFIGLNVTDKLWIAILKFLIRPDPNGIRAFTALQSISLLTWSQVNWS